MNDTKPDAVTTVVHAYYFNTEKPEEAAAYTALCETLQGLGLRCMATRGGWSDTERKYREMVRALDGRTVGIETAHLFADQLNTAPIDGVSESGLRVFDWKEDIYDNQRIKCGHWLEQTDSLKEARRNTHKCGYCGKQEPAAKGFTFCPHCIDSEYLKAEDLPLTRMQAIDEDRKRRAPLTQAESDYLMPLYIEAQTHGATERGRARMAKARETVAQRLANVTRSAKTEHDGMMWLLDRGFQIDNVIYYSHTDRFCFGWRKPLSAGELSRYLDVVSEFPFRYTLTADDEKVYENE